jgi:hypothetical protein
VLNLSGLLLLPNPLLLPHRPVMFDRLESLRPRARNISRLATDKALPRPFPLPSPSALHLSAFRSLRRIRATPPSRLRLGLNPAAEDFVHHVEPSAKQEVHRSIAAAKDVAGFRVDLF